jgi:hypothetical protein
VRERERAAARGAVGGAELERQRQCGGNVLSKYGSASMRFAHSAIGR